MFIKAVKFDVKEIFNVDVDKSNYRDIRYGLERERVKFIDKLKEYQSAGLINSLSRPQNKHLQKELDDISHKKRVIKHSISQINQIFFN